MLWIKFRKRKFWVSSTLRSIGDILDYSPKYDYVFLSFVFDSLSGSFQTGFTEQTLRNALVKTRYVIIARGGVSVSVIQKAHELGFHSVAFYSAIWKASNPLEEFKKIKAKFEGLKLPME